MDAMLKRRMWKVAIIHFVLTLFVITRFYNSGWSGPPGERMERWMAWMFFWYATLILLQPQLGALLAVAKFYPNVISHYSSHVPNWLLMIVWFGSIPLWSICFGWIFVKLDNW